MGFIYLKFSSASSNSFALASWVHEYPEENTPRLISSGLPNPPCTLRLVPLPLSELCSSSVTSSLLFGGICIIRPGDTEETLWPLTVAAGAFMWRWGCEADPSCEWWQRSPQWAGGSLGTGGVVAWSRARLSSSHPHPGWGMRGWHRAPPSPARPGETGGETLPAARGSVPVKKKKK